MRFLSIASLLYLLLPCLLFLAGWVQPYAAWPVGLALVGAVLPGPERLFWRFSCSSPPPMPMDSWQGR